MRRRPSRGHGFCERGDVFGCRGAGFLRDRRGGGLGRRIEGRFGARPGGETVGQQDRRRIRAHARADRGIEQRAIGLGGESPRPRGRFGLGGGRLASDPDARADAHDERGDRWNPDGEEARQAATLACNAEGRTRTHDEFALQLIKYRNDSAGRSLEDLLTTTTARRFLGKLTARLDRARTPSAPSRARGASDRAEYGDSARPRFAQARASPLTRKLHPSVEKLSAANAIRGGFARRSRARRLQKRIRPDETPPLPLPPR